MPADDAPAATKTAKAPPAKFGKGFLFDAWYYAALSREVKTGKLTRYEILGEPVLLGRMKNGAPFALRDICPHRGVPLSAGRIMPEGSVECPYHGWRWSLDGENRYVHDAVDFPGLTRDELKLPECAVDTFGGFIFEGYANHWAGLGTTVDSVDGQLNSGRLAAVKFFTGYIVEMSLSMDNVFVIALIFEHLKVPSTLQHRVLFWGVLGALVMRGVMIGGGAALVARWHWVFYLFGAFLIVTALKMLFAKEQEESPEEATIVRWLNRHFRVAKSFHGRHFVITEKVENPTWTPPNSPWAAGLEPIAPGPYNPLGTRWIGTTAPLVGIHGTPSDWSIGYLPFSSSGILEHHCPISLGRFVALGASCARLRAGVPS